MEMPFELIPAIDLKGGKCVRLQQGDAGRATEYGDDPVAMALYWQAQGAERLHLVDLDGAFSGTSGHLEVAETIFRKLSIPVQFGGGLRTLAHIEHVLELGAGRAILGSVAVEHPETVGEAVRRFPGSIVVAIDALDGIVALRGWIEKSAVAAIDLVRKIRTLGVERVIFTDISRDGVLRGANVEETRALARAAGFPVLASGGVSTLEDVRQLWLHRGDGIEGVILGRALYEKKLVFGELKAQLGIW